MKKKGKKNNKHGNFTPLIGIYIYIYLKLLVYYFFIIFVKCVKLIIRMPCMIWTLDVIWCNRLFFSASSSTSNLPTLSFMHVWIINHYVNNGKPWNPIKCVYTAIANNNRKSTLVNLAKSNQFNSCSLNYNAILVSESMYNKHTVLSVATKLAHCIFL